MLIALEAAADQAAQSAVEASARPTQAVGVEEKVPLIRCRDRSHE